MKKWYVPLCILLVAAFVPWVKEVMRSNALNNAAKLEMSPAYSVDKACEEFKWVKDREKEWTGRPDKVTLPSPSSYWEYLEREEMLTDALSRLVDTSGDFRVRHEAEGRYKSLTTFAPTTAINYRFQQKFGIKEMIDAKPKVYYGDNRSRRSSVKTNAAEKFLLGLFWSMPIMFLVFVVRLKDRGLWCGRNCFGLYRHRFSGQSDSPFIQRT